MIGVFICGGNMLPAVMSQYPQSIRLVYGFTLTSFFLFSESFHFSSRNGLS